jgi:PKD repeat protein
VNVSVSPATSIIPTNLTRATTYDWRWFQNTTTITYAQKINDAASETYNSGDTDSPDGREKKLEVSRRYVDPITGSTEYCPSAPATVTPKVIPNPTAQITTANQTICENSGTSVDILTKGYSSGAWTVQWELTKTGSPFSKTGTISPIANPSSIPPAATPAAGTGAAIITLLATDFIDTNPGQVNNGTYTLTLTAVKQTTTAYNGTDQTGCPGTIIGSPITITVTPAPSVTLSGYGPACQGDDYTIYFSSIPATFTGTANNISYPTGATGIPYIIEYTSSHTGATRHEVTLNDGDDLLIPASHISSAGNTTITFVSVRQGSCTGSVVVSDQHEIQLIPNPEQATILDPLTDQSLCAEDIALLAKSVTAADYTGRWYQISGPNPGAPLFIAGTFTPDNDDNASTTFEIGTNTMTSQRAYGRYELQWRTWYTGGAIQCPASTATVVVIFGTDAQKPVLSVPDKVCGDEVDLIATNTLNVWETGAWSTPDPLIAEVIPDPMDSRKAKGKLKSGKDGTAVFTYTITTDSPACKDDSTKTTVEFIGIPDLVMPASDYYVCPYDTDNNSTSNQIDFTLTDSKSLTGNVYEWYVAPDISVTSSKAGPDIQFNAPANNGSNDSNPYIVFAQVSRTVSGRICLTNWESFEVVVKPKPRVRLMDDLNLCPGEEVPISLQTPGINGTKTVTYHWTNSSVTQTAGLGDETLTSNTQTLYAVSKTPGATTSVSGGYLIPDYNSIELYAEREGCYSAKQNFLLTVNPKPVITLPTESTLYCPNVTIDASSTPATPSFSSNVSGADYKWQYSSAGSYNIGLPFTQQSGTDLGTFKTSPNLNNFNMTGVVDITVTGPVVSDLSGKGCIATGKFPVTLKPQPVMASMSAESVCAVEPGVSVNFPTDISFRTTNIPTSGISTLEYQWYNRNDDGIAGERWDLPLVLSATQTLSGTSGTGIFNISVPVSGDGVDREAKIVVYPYMDGCVGDSSVVYRTAFALPKLSSIPNDTVCAGTFFNFVSFIPDIPIHQIFWENNDTRIGLGTNGTGYSIDPFRAGTNNTGDNIDGTIKAWAVKSYSGLECKGPDSTFHKVVRPSPVLNITLDPIAGPTSICPEDWFPELKFSSPTTVASLRDKIEYSWIMGNSTIGVSMPGAGTGDMTSYQGNSNTGGTTRSGVVTLSAMLNGCPSYNNPTTTFYLKPTPVMDFIADREYCPDQTVTTIVIGSNVAGKENTGTQWTLVEPLGPISQYYSAPPTTLSALGSGGSGNIPGFRTNINNGISNLEGTFAISAVVDACVSDTKQFTIEVKPTPDIDQAQDIFLCHDDVHPTITFSSPNFPAATFEWKSSNFTSIATLYPSGTVSTSGTGTIPGFRARNSSTGMTGEVSSEFEVQAKTEGCYSPPETFTITVGAVPQLGFSDLSICATDEITPDNFSMIVDPLVVYVPGDTTYHWTVKDVQPGGWKTEHDLPAIGLPQTGSIGTFHPDTARVWNSLGGYWVHNSLWGEDEQKITIEAYVTLKASDVTGLGCASNKRNMTITIKPLPITKIMEPDNNCVKDGEVMVYQVENEKPRSGYHWTDGFDGPGAPAGMGPVMLNTDTTYYKNYVYPANVVNWNGYIEVRERNQFGCWGPAAKLDLSVVAAPRVDAGRDRIVCAGDTVHLHGTVLNLDPTGTYSYDWFPGGLMDNYQSTDPVLSPMNTANYSFRAKNGNCESNPAWVTVSVLPKPETPQLPDPIALCESDDLLKITAVRTLNPGYPAGDHMMHWFRRVETSPAVYDTIRISNMIGGTNTPRDSVSMSMKLKAVHPEALPWYPGDIDWSVTSSMDTTIYYQVYQSLFQTHGGENFTCRSDLSQPARLIIRRSPDAPVGFDFTYCPDPSGRYNIWAESTANAPILNWYDSSGSVVRSGENVWVTPGGTSPVDIPETASSAATFKPFKYYAEASTGYCPSARTEVNLTVYPNPTLTFNMTPDDGGCSPLVVNAMNTSPSANDFVSYQWIWGNPDSTDLAPRNVAVPHTFHVSGTIAETVWVRLTGESKTYRNSTEPDPTKGFCYNEVQKELVIHPGVIADFVTGESEGCSPLNIFFTSTSSNAYNYRWYWNPPTEPRHPNHPTIPGPVIPVSSNSSDPYFGATGPNPLHVFTNTTDPTEKTYRVWLQVDNGACFDNKYADITVYPVPDANFKHNLYDDYGSNSICPPLPVMFTNLSSNTILDTKYAWNFADGALDTVAFSPTPFAHDYHSLNASAPIPYMITMSAIKEYKTDLICSSSYHLYINVNPQVLADFTGDSIMCSPATARFQSQSLGAVSYHEWDFGDYSPVETDRNPSHRYENNITHDEEKHYRVKLKAGNSFGCSDTISRLFILYPQPVASFKVDQVVGCQPLEVTFTNTSNLNSAYPNPPNTLYIFDYRDGYADSLYTTADTTHRFINTLGVNSLVHPTMTAINAWGCTNTTPPQTITILPYVKANFNMADTVGCAPLSITFLNGSAGFEDYMYTFGDGDIKSGNKSDPRDYAHSFKNESMYRDTTYYVTLTVTSGYNCTDAITKEITVYGTPIARFRPGSPYPSDFQYPAPNIQLDNLIPYPDRDKLSYLWSWTEQYSGYVNNFETAANPGPLRIPDWGYFDITQQVVNVDKTTSVVKCSDSQTLTIRIVPPAVIAYFDEVLPDCMPYDVQFFNGSKYAIAYRWDFGDGTYNTNVENPKHTYTEAGTYTVRLTAIGEALDQAIFERNVVVHPRPQPSFIVTPTFLWVGQPLRASNYTPKTTSNGALIDMWYEWDWGDNSPKDTSEDPSHIYLKAGNYSITLTVGTNTDPQCIAKITKSDAVELENSGDIVLPNVFKPRPSGEPPSTIPTQGYKNDLFYPPAMSPVRKYSFMIFTRWGQKIFETNDPTEGWNGYFRGRLCDEDVYQYKIEGVFETGQSFMRMGNVALLR